MLCQKAYSDILPRFGVRITSREIVPGSRISPLFSPRIVSLHYRSLLLSAAFWAAGEDSSGRWAGTISRKASFWGMAVCSRDWKGYQRV